MTRAAPGIDLNYFECRIEQHFSSSEKNLKNCQYANIHVYGFTVDNVTD